MKSTKSQKPTQSTTVQSVKEESDPYTQKLRAAVIKAGTAMREYKKLHPLKIHPQ